MSSGVGSGGIVEIFLPAGGTAGQVLGKIDAQDYNATWVAPGGGGGGVQSISAGTTQAVGAQVVFSNSNGVSFGVAGNTVTASVAAGGGASTVGVYGISNTTGQSSSSSYALSSLPIVGAGIISIGQSAGSIQISAPVPTVFTQLSVGNSTGGNTAGDTGVVSGQLVLAGGANITLSGSTNAGSMTISVVGGAGGGGVAIAASNSTFTSGTVVLSAAGGALTISNGAQSALFSVPATSSLSATGAVSLSTNGSTISIGAPLVSHGISLGNTSGNTGTVSNQLVLAGGNNVTLSGSTNAAGMTVTISGANAGGAQTGISGMQVSNTTYTSGTVTLQNANGISFGSSGANGISASYTVPSTAGLLSAVNVSAGTTSNNLSAITFGNSNGVSFGLNASTLTASVSQSVQTVGLYASSQTTGQSSSSTADARSLSVVGQGIISAGLSNGSLLLSATTAAQTVQPVAVSGSNGSFAFSTLTMGALNGLTFYTSNGSMVGSYTVPTQSVQSAGVYASSQTYGQSSSSTYDARSLSVVGSGGISVGWSNGSLLVSGQTTTPQTNQSAIKAFGASNTGNTAGNTGVSTGIDWVLAGSNNITISQSTNAGGPNTLWVSGPTVGGAQTGISGIVVSNTTYTSGTVSFSNANGMSFGSSAGQAITASYTVPSTAGLISGLNVSGGAGNSQSNVSGLTFANSNGLTFGVSTGANVATVTASYTVPTQTNQTLGIYASSQTFGQSSSSTYDARSISVVGSGGISVGWSNSSLLISGQTTTPQTNQTAGIYASSQTFGQSSSSTHDARSLTIVGSGGVSVGWSNSSLMISGTTYPAQSTQSAIKAFGASNTGNTAGNTGVSTGIDWVLAGSNNITISQSTAAGGPNTLWVSGPTVGGAQTGISGIVVSNTTYTSGTVTFQNANGISFGSSGANGISASYTVPTQTVQSLGIYASSQTTGQSSSSTYDARSLSIVGQGIISAGWSNSSLLLSATTSQSVQTQASGNIAGVGTTFAGTNISASITLNSVGLNLALSGGAGGGGGGGIGAGVSTMGNTAGSTGTVTTGNVIFVGSGPISLSQSTGAAGSAATITINAPATSSLVGVNGISLSTNGSTISISNQQWTAQFYEPEIYGGTTTGTQANGTVYLRPFRLDGYAAFNQIRFLQQMTSLGATTARISASVSAGNASSGTASFGLSGTVLLFSRVSTGTAANSSQIISFDSVSYTQSLGQSISVSWSTNVSSMSASWTTSGAIGFISNINSTGGITTGSFGTSGSSTFSSTSTNANSISTTVVMSFASAVLSQVRPLLIPMGTTLSPGDYWMGHIQSTNTGSTNYSHQANVSPSSLGLVYYSTNSSGYAEIGNTATINSSNMRWGIGSYSASSQTTTSIPLTAISAQSNYSLYFNAQAYTK